MDWITHTFSAIGGSLATGLPILFWAWKQKNSIQGQEAKDAYEMNKLRSSDYGKELASIIAELRADRDRQSARIMNIESEHLDCERRSAKQDIEIYKQTEKITYLEERVKHLEGAATIAAVTAAATATETAASLIRTTAATAAATATELIRSTALATSSKATTDALGDIAADNAANIDRLKVHDQRNIDGIAQAKEDLAALTKVVTLGSIAPK
jgi:hypothetical protein